MKDKRSLLVVPWGALTALPFHLLVTEKPAAAIPDKFEGYRDAAWLLKRHAVSVLPSVASLKTLRVYARKEQGTKPMTGFGDPLFSPSQEGAGDKRGAAKPGAVKSAARGVTNAAYTDFWQGAGVDRARLAQALPQLPDTADELNAVAKDLGVSASDIHLGQDASETTVKRAPLADYSIVYFATHGLVAGDVKGVAEPSLVLSIPKQPSELDDGLLTSSEVAQLKLNAGWVVLSACNTIAGDKARRRSAFGAGAILLLCRCPRAAGVALGGRFRSRYATCDIDLRASESRSEARPGRGAASGDARLPRRCFIAPKRLSGAVGALCPDRRGRGPISKIVQRNNGHSASIAADGRAPNPRKTTWRRSKCLIRIKALAE